MCCKKCNETKSTTSFYKNRSKKFGISQWCKDCHKADKIAIAKADRKYRIKKFYGLKEEDINALLRSQNGLCLICRDYLTNPCVDHDHKTGKIRGLLCSVCNRVLGLLHDDITLLQNAISYLQQYG